MVTSMHKLYIYYAPFRFVCTFLILIEHVFCYKRKLSSLMKVVTSNAWIFIQYTHQ